MSGVASIRLAPIHTKTVLQRTEVHNERKEGDKTGKHIDKEKSYKNKMLIGSINDDFYKAAVEKITGQQFTDDGWNKSEALYSKDNLRFSNGRKVRSDAIIAAETIAHYPGKIYMTEMGDRYPADEKEFQAWQDNTIKFLQDKFGKENVINAVLHMDESSPHIHAVVIPICENKNKDITLRLSNYVNGKKGCAQLQTEYAKAVGYERGVSQEKVNYQTVKQGRAILSKSVGAELPEVQKGESAKEYRERVNPEYEKVRVQRDVAKADAKKYKNAHRKSGEKDQKINALQKENEDLRRQADNLEKELAKSELERKKAKQKEELEKIGIEHSKNTEDEKRIYHQLKESYINLGKKYAKEHDLDIIDLDNDGIDDRITGYKDENHNGTDDRFEPADDLDN